MAATVEPDHGQAETIARTLVLAQRTADATVADAQDRARTIVASAEERGRSVVDEAEGRASQIVRAAEERSAQMIEKAKADAVQAQAGERARVEAEVNALTSQRSELHHTIELLGGHVLDQRARLSGAADALRNVLESPAGLRHVAPPVPNPAADSLSSSASSTSAGGSSGSSASTSGFGTSSVASAVGDAVESTSANVPPPPTSPAAASDAAHVLATETANLSGHVSAEAATLPGIAETTDEVPAFNDVRWAPETEEA